MDNRSRGKHRRKRAQSLGLDLTHSREVYGEKTREKAQTLSEEKIHKQLYDREHVSSTQPGKELTYSPLEYGRYLIGSSGRKEVYDLAPKRQEKNGGRCYRAQKNAVDD